MEYNTLISTTELLGQLQNPNWIIVDCRFDLQKLEWGHSDYLIAHIPGALYANLDSDLSGPKTLETGRHPLPDRQAVIDLFSRWGIDQGKQVVVYDTSGGSFAARLWWTLRFYGHSAVAVLDGSFQKWKQEALPVDSGEGFSQASQFIPGASLEKIVDAQQVEALRGNPDYKLVDARGEARFRGEQETIDPVAGHIPGAVNRFYGLNLAPGGTFLGPVDLKNQFIGLLGAVPSDHSIVYCGSGVTSCHLLLAMRYAGLPEGQIYIGSWSEWIRNPLHPIATGNV
jgi:thiosulfate/3-mercaptopyruvate sulfurtransferase